MGNTFLTLGPIQSIGIGLLGIALTIGTLTLILRQGTVQGIEASDGTKFSSEEARSAYEAMLKNLKPLYEEDESRMEKGLQFQRGFLGFLKKSGFNDLKTLLIYKDDIKRLVELFEKE